MSDVTIHDLTLKATPADDDEIELETAANLPRRTTVGGVKANVNAQTDASGFGYVVDEDDMSSDDDTKLPTQQSVKAYVDAGIGGVSSDISDVASNLSDHLADADDAHDDSAISAAPQGELVGATVREHLGELDARTQLLAPFNQLRDYGVIIEDFVGRGTASLQIGTHGWAEVISGTAAAVDAQASASSTMVGTVSLAAGSTSSGSACLRLNHVMLTAADQAFTFEWRLLDGRVHDEGVDEAILRFGMMDSVDATEPSHGFYFESIENANWHAVCANSGARTKVDLGVAPAIFGIKAGRVTNDGAGAVRFQLFDGSFSEEADEIINEDLPSGGAYGPNTILAKTVGTSNFVALVDYFALVIERSA